MAFTLKTFFTAQCSAALINFLSFVFLRLILNHSERASSAFGFSVDQFNEWHFFALNFAFSYSTGNLQTSNSFG
jgi:hypothetical protein